MTTSTPSVLTSKIIAFVASRRFFLIVVGFFVFEAAWIALSGRYPMAFDEDFHMGIIQIYAHHLSPFLSGQPAGADSFGAVARDPSYLYQYLMSFPYRLIRLFTHDQAATVLILRAINIALFTAALPLYRRLLLKTGASRALAHLSMAVFILIPIAPFLAAQINYDNLLMPLTAGVLLLTVRVSEELMTTRRLNVKYLLALIIAGLLTCLVKYAFLPILLASGIYLLVRLRQTYPSFRKFRTSLGFGFTLLTRRTRWLLVIGAILACGLFAQRYGVNVARYHTPVADCGQVLSVQHCSAYAPWDRDYNLSLRNDGNSPRSPLVYTADWFYGMWLRTFFAVDGPGTNFQTRGPLVMPSLGAIFFAGAGFLAVLATARRLLRKYDARAIWLFGAVIAGYAGVLWLNGYQSFLKVGQANAVNGRYLLPIMPLVLLICGLGWNELLRGRQRFKLVVAGAALVCMLWGGGALTYILRSENTWYWHNQAVYDANHAVKTVLGPIIPGYRSPTEFMGHN